MTEQNLPVISFKDFSFQYRAQKKPTLTGINLAPPEVARARLQAVSMV